MQREDTGDWQARVDALWAEIDRWSEDEFLARMRALAAERPAGDPLAPFELGGAHDSTGHPDLVALVSAGREREAAGVALTALAGHLRRYRRSLTNYASELSSGTDR